jgi:formaldehyde-activating enzyme involved in methanogenesis
VTGAEATAARAAADAVEKRIVALEALDQVCVCVCVLV